MAISKKGGSVAEIVRQFVKPYSDELGLTVWDVKYLKEGADWYLRIFIDKPGGILIDDCVNLTHAITKPLDELNPIKDPYILEVCSPGIDRELTRPEHFEYYMGENVSVRLIRPDENGQREFSGKLAEYDDNKVTIETDNGKKISFMRKEASWVKLQDNFDGGLEDE